MLGKINEIDFNERVFMGDACEIWVAFNGCFNINYINTLDWEDYDFLLTNAKNIRKVKNNGG